MKKIRTAWVNVATGKIRQTTLTVTADFRWSAGALVTLIAAKTGTQHSLVQLLEAQEV